MLCHGKKNTTYLTSSDNVQKVKSKNVKFTIEQATKAKKVGRGIAVLLF
jgi:hypothetical protein